MKLLLRRFSTSGDDTLGILHIDGVWQCYTLEDEARTVKVFGETRIPDGIYKIILRTIGGFHNRYRKKYPGMHKGMLWLQDVPNFEYILIHTGNRDDDTAGCLLVGSNANDNTVDEGFVGGSRQAYKKIYPPVARAILNGEDVEIEITTIG
jgi:hypothetical protein